MMLTKADGLSSGLRSSEVDQMNNTYTRKDEGKLLLKACPRCSGDYRLDRDHQGWYVMCFACGHVSYPGYEVETTALPDRPRRSA